MPLLQAAIDSHVRPKRTGRNFQSKPIQPSQYVILTHFYAIFVPFQAMLDEATKLAPPDHWANDGVHPSTFGASLMAHNWLRAICC
jgi:lysophospholipase L1-like esterase